MKIYLLDSYRNWLKSILDKNTSNNFNFTNFSEIDLILIHNSDVENELDSEYEENTLDF